MPQVAIAQPGSSLSTSRNACSPAEYQNEWSIATARSNAGCTLASQLVGNDTLPRRPPCAWEWSSSA